MNQIHIQGAIALTLLLCLPLGAEGRRSNCDESRTLLQELKCRCKGMRWHKNKCLRWRRAKRKTIRVTPPQPTENKKGSDCHRCCVIITKSAEQKSSASPAVNVSQKQTMLFVAPFKAPKANPQNTPKPARQPSHKWWKAGGGFFMLGFWMNDARNLISGPYVSFSVSLDKWLRISGLIGYGFSPKEEHYMLGGGNFNIRVIGNLWFIAGLDSIWAKFNGLQVNERILLGNVGLEYWPKPWLSISGRLNLGHRSFVTDCDGEDKHFVGGNAFLMSFHY